MRRLYIFLLLCIALSFTLLNSPAQAIVLGTNITIPDRMGYGDGWYSAAREDQEVEPRNDTGQNWDLEGFYFDQNTKKLSLVGGYNFSRWDGGDIFIDVDGNAVYGPDADGTGSGNWPSFSDFGYDYVLKLNFNTLSYDLIALDTRCLLTQTVSSHGNQESNPWRHLWGGSNVSIGDFDFESGLKSSDVDNLKGSRHYALVFDFVELLDGEFKDFDSLIFHYTMVCGNDNVMGKYTKCAPPVPEPSTVLLMGMGLLGLAAWGRKRMKK